MGYNSFAFFEGLIFLVNFDAKTNYEKNKLHYKMKYQLQTAWDGVGNWKFMP